MQGASRYIFQRVNTRLCTLLLGLLALGCLYSTSAAARSSDLLRYHVTNATLEASLSNVELSRVATRLSKVTGWRVEYDPDTDVRLSVKFKEAPVSEALRKLLGDLNFSLLPSTNGSARLLIYRTNPSQATRVVEMRVARGRSRATNVIENELVIALDPNSKKSAAEIAAELGGKVVSQLGDEAAYRLSFADKAAADAARERLINEYDDVIGVDDNFSINRPNNPLMAADSAAPQGFGLKPAPPGNGKTIVGLIDMPVQPIDGPMKDFLLPSINVTGETKELAELSHGTSMAQTVLQGLAAATPPDHTSNVRVLPIDVYGANGTTTTFDVARGIVTAVNNGATVLNLSLGGEGDSPFLDSLITEVRGRGVMVLAAAGNQPTTAPTWPAAHPDVIAVTAADRRGNVAPYANRGQFVDLLAPGTSKVQFNNQTFFVSGTSTATAFVSGVAAAHASAGKSQAEVQYYLQRAFPMRTDAPTVPGPPQP